MIETIVRRVLGALRPVDGNTGLRIESPLVIRSPGVRLWPNRRGYFVIASVPGLEEHTVAFERPPPEPALESIEVEFTIRDPRRRYLARRAKIRLPRDPDPDHAARAGSLFRVIDVSMFPAPAGDAAPGSAVIRATVVDGDGGRLPGALLRVFRNGDNQIRARGLSDWAERTRGEAMVPVPGIPVTTWGEDAGDVVVHKVAVTVEVVFDPGFDPQRGPPDPDHLETKPAGSRLANFDFDLASGQILKTRLSVD